MRCLIAAVMSVALLVQVATGQDAGRPFGETAIVSIDRAVKSEIESQGLVGVAVGVIVEGEIAYLGSYGKADIDRDVAVTEETVFNWASNSKPVMAVAAMQLVQAGKLDLDADVRRYVPEFPEKSHVVSARHLLCHQSGIPHYSNGRIVGLTLTDLEPPDDTIPSQAMWRFAGSPLIFAPGERQEYSSYAYVLLSAVVENAGGEPINEQLHQRILDPVGMGSFQMDVADAGQEHWTRGYTRTSAGQFLAVGDCAHAWKHGAGGYKSNVRDFAKWARSLLEPTLVDSKTESEMWTRQKLNDGTEAGYGLGFVVEGSGKDLKISHGGSQDETKTRLVVWPNREMGVVVMCNTNHCDAGKISTAIMGALQKSKVNPGRR